jgi:pimeloyl-ACP methyl ester carboxylesterase
MLEDYMKGFIEQFGISYLVEGDGEAFVILHGWGCNKEMFSFLVEQYKKKYRVFAFDLPGFGESREPGETFNTQKYVDLMSQVFTYLNINNPIVLGHSFGGRILIKMATQVEFSKMILVGSAGIVNKRPLNYYIKVYTYKTLKYIYKCSLIRWVFPTAFDRLKKNAGSSDYNKASERMKQVLSTVVNEDLRELFPQVKVPTLLIWGEKDTATPLSDAKLMEKGFKDAGLVIFEGGSHYAFLEQKNRFITVLDAFI